MKVVMVAALIVSGNFAVMAQKTTAEAYLRVAYKCKWPANPGWPNQRPPAACEIVEADNGHAYAIEIYMPQKLANSVYQALVSPGADPSLGTVFADSEPQPYDIEVSKNDPPASSDANRLPQGPGTRTRLVVYLPNNADLTKTYQIVLNYPVDSDDGAIIYKPYLVSVAKEHTAELATGDQTGCPDRLSLRVRFDDKDEVLSPIGKPAPAPDKVPLKYATALVQREYDQYVSFRLGGIIAFINQLKATQQLQTVSVKVELTTKPVAPPPELNVKEVDGRFLLPNADEWVPKAADLPKLTVRDVDVAPNALRAGVQTNRVLVCFDTKEKVPASDFSALASLQAPAPGAAAGAAAPPAPSELAKDFAATGLKGRKTETAPEVFATTGEVGTRSVDHDLDIVGSFSNTVETKDKKDPNDPNKTIKVKERTTRATLDLLIAPFGIRSKICFNGPFKPCDVLGDERKKGALYRIVTPFFVDAKVSTGKLNDDTLSLNRILFGTRADYQIIVDNSPYPTYLVFSGKFSNASDRDFKLAEYKGTFEFRPVFSFLNHPLANREPVTQTAVVKDAANAKDPTKVFPRTQGGYEFIPFFGAELGRTWAHRGRPAVAPSATVKRAYVGLDIILNPFSRTTLTLNDTFYFRIDTKDDPRDNYFKGALDFRIGKFRDNARTAHSIYFSFERGQQPPFNDPGVNALKLGYRIRGVNVFGPQ
jgi:hypothetical protein